jgi:hypothetical protein
MKPTIGIILHYTLNSQDAEMVNRRRVAKPHDPGWPAGAQAHSGNSASAGQVVPVIVTAVWIDTCVNGQALLDGNDSLWVTSRMEGTEPGTWRWPARVE